MSWSTPKTWVANDILTAAELNTDVRDNMNAVIPVPSTITTTGTQTALAIPDGRGHLVLLCNNASALTLQGITAAAAGQTLDLVSIGAGIVTLENQHASASAANRIINHVTGTITLAAGSGRARLVYDGTTSRWRVVEHEQGAWVAVAHAGGNFTASSGSWTVDVGDQTTFAYWLKGRTLHVAVFLVNTNVSATPTTLQIAIPNSLSATKSMRVPCVVADAGTAGTGMLDVAASGAVINCYKDTAGAAWSTTGSNNTNVIGELFLEVS